VNVVIAGGGTAGHVFPALALADRLSQDGDAVTFVGSPDGQEATRVPAAGYPFHAVAASPVKREFSVATVGAPIVAMRSAKACRPLVRDADVVVGVGGYVSVPAVLAARLARRPIVLHEQNAIPSLANRSLARLATAIGVSFGRSRVAFPARARVELTGNPVREMIGRVPANRSALAAEAWETLDLLPDRSTVVVLGGSQGALSLDRSVAAMLEATPIRDRDDVQLLVLTGPSHGAVVSEVAAGSMALRVRVVPFLDRMDLALAIADLAVARAGAGHIAELTACGVPSILVPYPHATGNHQEANARELVGVGAASLYLDEDLSGPGLSMRILGLIDDGARREAMAKASASWGRPDADRRLAALVREVAGP
jgi:UDP-N-acetylglucosamine--N-acetylmuramyl-(pentapeptide) pyrophosphoryl-undecaprenol N-acetylglucosamine transferase